MSAERRRSCARRPCGTPRAEPAAGRAGRCRTSAGTGSEPGCRQRAAARAGGRATRGPPRREARGGRRASSRSPGLSSPTSRRFPPSSRAQRRRGSAGRAAARAASPSISSCSTATNDGRWIGARHRHASGACAIFASSLSAYQTRFVPSEAMPCSRSSHSKISARVRGSAVNFRRGPATRLAISSASGVTQPGEATSSAVPKSPKSRVETRCTVPRIRTPRAIVRFFSARSSAGGRNPSSRVQSPMYGVEASCACRPATRSTARTGGSFTRRSSNWRASVARLSSRCVRTRSAMAVR